MLEELSKKELLELGKAICTQIGARDIECVDIIIIGNTKYAFEEVESMKWESEGKYDNGEGVWQIGVADDTHPWNIKEGGRLDLYIMQCASRSGSYFSDYYYDYYEPSVVERREIVTTVWAEVQED